MALIFYTFYILSRAFPSESSFGTIDDKQNVIDVKGRVSKHLASFQLGNKSASLLQRLASGRECRICISESQRMGNVYSLLLILTLTQTVRITVTLTLTITLN
jgi:hypothetical protein